MTAFLTEFARKLADKWLVLLVLPGLMFLGVVAVAGVLGQRHWRDAQRVAAAANRLIRSDAAHPPVAVVLAVLAVSLAAAGAGLVARGLGWGVQAVWLGEWPSPDRWPACRLVQRRRHRWERLNDAYATLVLGRAQQAAPTADEAAIGTARNRIALAPPSRATWMGDRIAAVDARVHAQYRLDLVTTWPRLWLLLPDAARAELRAAHGWLQDATSTAAWGGMYAVVGIRWWPAAALGAVMMVAGWRRGRVATGGLADLIEATVDVFHRDLTAALGLTPASSSQLAELGDEITSRFSKGA